MDWKFRMTGVTFGYKTGFSQTQIYWPTLNNSCSLLMGLKCVVLRPLYSRIGCLDAACLSLYGFEHKRMC